MCIWPFKCNKLILPQRTEFAITCCLCFSCVLIPCITLFDIKHIPLFICIIHTCALLHYVSITLSSADTYSEINNLAKSPTIDTLYHHQDICHHIAQHNNQVHTNQEKINITCIARLYFIASLSEETLSPVSSSNLSEQRLALSLTMEIELSDWLSSNLTMTADPDPGSWLHHCIWIARGQRSMTGRAHPLVRHLTSL